MRKMKRFVSLLLAIAMLLTTAVFTLTAHAEETELPAVEVTDADWLLVEKLEALGTITNAYEDIGMYVTRRQMVDIIVKYLRMQVSGVSNGKSPFMDVPKNDASIDAITALYNSGVITGDNEYKFHPDDYLTYDEAIVFVVNAVGHKLFANREGGFPTGYHRIAIKYDMLDGLKFNSGKEYIPLCDVYKMLESALDIGAVVPAVFSDGSVDYRISKTETFLSDVYNISKSKGIVTGTENTKLDSPDSNLTDEQVEINKVVYDTPGYVYATSIGRAVDYYIRKNADNFYDVAYVEENDKLNNIVKVDADEILKEKSNNDIIYYLDEAGKERHVKMLLNFDLIYNNKKKGYGLLKKELPTNGYIEALDNNNDEVADVLFIYNYESMVIDSVDTFAESFTETVFSYEIDPSDPSTAVADVVNLGTYGDKINIRQMPGYKKMTLETLKQGDVATVMRSDSTPQMITVYISRQTITGTVMEQSDVDGYMINNEFYEVAADKADVVKPIVGVTATFYLDYNNQIVGYKRDAASAAVDTASGAYGVLTGVDYDDTSVASEFVVRIYTAEGELKELPLKNVTRIDNVPYTVATQLTDINTQLTNGRSLPYVVRYVLSGGEVSSLDTGKTGQDGKLQEFAAGTRLLSRTKGFIRDLDNQLYSYFKPNETIVFCTPEAGELDDAEGYKIISSLKNSSHYEPASGQPYQIWTDRYALYNIKGSEFDIAEVILLVGVNQAAMGGTGSLKVVTEITTAVDAEGMEAAKIYVNGKTSSQLVAADFTINDAAPGCTVANLGTVIKPGTLISTDVNPKGLVENITIYGSYDATTGFTPTSKISTAALISSNDTYTVSGEVTFIDNEEKLMQFKNSAGVEQPAPVSGGVVVYRMYNGKPEAYEGTTADIAEGDYIVIRGKNYYDIEHIIVYKQ